MKKNIGATIHQNYVSSIRTLKRFLQSPDEKNIYATIHIGREIRCLPYVGFFFSYKKNLFGGCIKLKHPAHYVCVCKYENLLSTFFPTIELLNQDKANKLTFFHCGRALAS